MLQVTVDDTVDVDMVAYALYVGNEGTVSSYYQLDVYPCLRSLIQLVHHQRVGDMIDLYLDVGIFSGLLVLDFIIDQVDELVSHLVRRNKQFLELYRTVWTLDKVEYLMYILHDARSRRHQHTVGIHTCIPFVEVTRTDAGNIRSLFHLDMRNFRVYLQAFHAKDYVYSRILHLFRPVDVRSLIKPGQQLDDHRNLFPVACGRHQCLDHLRLLCQSVQRNLDALYLLVYSSFLKYPDKRIKVMERYMDKPVFLLNLCQQAVFAVQFFLQNRRPLRILQVASSAIGEFHEILVVLVASAGYHRIQGIQIHLLQYPSQHILRHARVIDYTQRLSTATALHTLRDFLQGTRTQVIVYFHFRVAGKLEGIRLKIREAQSLEHQWQAAADHIIQVNQVTLLFVVRQADKASADVDR